MSVFEGFAGRQKRPANNRLQRPMTSTVKRHDDARTGRAVAPSGLVPDVVDVGVIGSGTMGLCGRIPRERPPWRSSILSPLRPSVSWGRVDTPARHRVQGAGASWEGLEPPAETEPVTATVDHADIRGLGTTVQVSVAAPASLEGRGSWPHNAIEDCADTGAAPPPMARDHDQRRWAPSAVRRPSVRRPAAQDARWPRRRRPSRGQWPPRPG